MGSCRTCIINSSIAFQPCIGAHLSFLDVCVLASLRSIPMVLLSSAVTGLGAFAKVGSAMRQIPLFWKRRSWQKRERHDYSCICVCGMWPTKMRKTSSQMCMFSYIYVYNIYICICIYIYIFFNSHIFTYKDIHISTHTYIYIHVYILKTISSGPSSFLGSGSYKRYGAGS